MAEEKRYYWLKLQKDFFSSKRIKKLRRMAGGDTYTIIYLKLQLLAVNTGGYLEYTGLEETFAAELALDIDESAEDVQVALSYFLHCGLAEMVNDVEMLLPYVADNTGSEGASAKRMREHRDRKALVNQDCLKLPQNAAVTTASQSDGETSQCDNGVTAELRRDRVRDRVRDREEIEIYTADKPQTRTRFIKPTVEEVAAYCRERGNNIDPQGFIDHYESNGWKVGKTPMQDWKAAVRTWERNGKSGGKATQPINSPDKYQYGKERAL